LCGGTNTTDTTGWYFTGIREAGTAMLLSIGDQIRDGAYKVHSRFNRVVNFTDGDRLVALVGEDIGAGPLNIVVGGVDLSEVHSLEIRRQSVILDSRVFSIDNNRRYHSGIAFRPSHGMDYSIETFQRNLAVFRRLLVETSHPKSLAFLLDESRIENFNSGFERAVVKHIVEGVHKIYSVDVIGGVKALRGCGFGLTPSGDDFISGLFICLNLFQKMYRSDFSAIIETIYRASRSGNIFSNTFLYLAKEGLLFENVKNLIATLLYGDKNEVVQSTERLLSVGESSGADLATGFFMTAQEVPCGFQSGRGEALWS